jgi:hypothetical protein
MKQKRNQLHVPRTSPTCFIGYTSTMRATYCLCGAGPVEHHGPLCVLADVGGRRPLCEACARSLAPILLDCLLAFWPNGHGPTQRTSLTSATRPGAGAPTENWIPITEYVARVEHPRVQHTTLDPTTPRVEEARVDAASNEQEQK